MGDTKTLKVRGAKNIAVYRARFKEAGAKKPTLSKARATSAPNARARCGSGTRAGPNGSIRSRRRSIRRYPSRPEDVSIMLDFAAPWTDVPKGRGHKHFREFPNESIVDWHKKHGLEVR